MRPLNTLATITLAAFMVVALGACGKKKNGSSGSTAAATPGSTCTNYNPLTGQYTNAQGQICTPGAQSQQVCPAAPNNYVTMPNGQIQPCTPGQMVNTGGVYTYPGQYPYNPYQNSGCDQYYYYYGIQYVPVNLNGTLQCVRIDVLNQYAQGTPYYNNYDYYYAYPPYSYGGSGYCGTQVYVAISGFAGAVCF